MARVLDERIDIIASRVGERLGTELFERPDSSRAIDELLARGRDGRDYGLSDDDLLAYIAERLAPEDSWEVVSDLNVADLYWAAGCCRNHPRAIADFERELMPDLRHVIAKVSGTSDHDDIAQMLRSRLFVAADGELPKIADYSGRGRLFSWLRVVAVRETLTSLRKNRRELLVGNQVPETAISDLELDVFKGMYQREFKAAFATAVAELEPRERALLKLHLVDKLSVDAIGAAHKVHRTSAARWLREIRAKLATGTRDHLAVSLGLADGDLDSVMRLVRSRLELSVTRLLGAS